MELLKKAWDLFMHLDKHLNAYAGDMHAWLYLLLFGIIFCETGLVILPFLPGDSLLFAVGALTATEGSPISFPLVAIVMIAAAILGDAVNYSIGKAMGPKIFSRPDSRWLNKEHLLKAHAFYETYGGKTIIIARFIPIIRTFAPFVAGIAQMSYFHFAMYNVVGAIAWVLIFLGAGWRLGRIEWIQTHFGFITIGIIVISVLPAVVEFFLAKRRSKQAKAGLPVDAGVNSADPE